MLTVQVVQPGQNAVFVAHRGVLGCVYPGGRFVGLSFDELLRLGTGEHDVAVPNEREYGPSGQEPIFESEWRKQLEWFKFILFGHHVGAYTALEVLTAAERVLKARNETGA